MNAIQSKIIQMFIENSLNNFLFSLEIFASADAAYVLAYSVIMLTTDLHSVNVSEFNNKIVLIEIECN